MPNHSIAFLTPEDKTSSGQDLIGGNSNDEFWGEGVTRKSNVLRRNIAFVCTEMPYPPNTGGRIYIWERLKQLHKNGYKIHLFCYCHNEIVNYEEMLKICESVKVYYFPNRIGRFLKGFSNPLRPYFVNLYRNNDIKHRLTQMAKERTLDLVIIDLPQLLKNCPIDIRIPIVLTQHNIEYELLKSIAKTSTNPIIRIFYYRECNLMKKYEESFYVKKTIDGYVFISSENMDAMRREYALYPCICIPPGYEVRRRKLPKENKRMIIFVGKMDYLPNVTAAVWFVKKVFPEVKMEVPEAKFFVIGKNPTQEVLELANIDGVTVTGGVPDLDKYLEETNIYVIPLQSGSGVKLKMFEAIGSSNLTVSTSKGVEGTPFENNRHLLVADEPEKFAMCCVEMLKNPEKFYDMIESGVSLIEKDFSWDGIGEKYCLFLENIASKTNMRYSI